MSLEKIGGGEEALGNWTTLYRGGLMNVSPDRVTDSGSGGTALYQSNGSLFTASTDGDWGVSHVGGTRNNVGATLPTPISGGSLLIKTTYISNTAISSLVDDHFIGVLNAQSAPKRTDNDIAIFNPTVGDSTSGNVRVDNGGVDTDGSLTYSTITEQRTYLVLVDYDGNYLNPNETGFYVNKDPRAGDDPDVKLSDTPNLSTDRVFGVGFVSNGAADSMITPTMEVSFKR